MAPVGKKPEPPDIPTLVAIAAARSLRMSADRRQSHIDNTLDVLGTTAKQAHKDLIKTGVKSTQNRLQPVEMDDIAVPSRRKRNLINTEPMLKRPDPQIVGMSLKTRLKKPSVRKKLSENTSPLAHLVGAPVVFSGATSPPGKHHAQVFEQVKQKARSLLESPAYVATTVSEHPILDKGMDKALRSSLTTEDKVDVWNKVHGVDRNSILTLKNAYDLNGAQHQLTTEGPVVFAVGEKDSDRVDPDRFQHLGEGVYQSKSTPNFHLMVVPNVSNGDVPYSATQFRTKAAEATSTEARQAIAEQYFGKTHPLINDLMSKYNNTIREVGLKEGIWTNSELRDLNNRPGEMISGTLSEDKRSVQSAGERLERKMKMQTGAKTSRTHSKPVTNDKLLHKRAKRAAHYTIRKELSPNYSSLSSQQKADIDKQVEASPKFAQLSTHFFDKYLSKAGGTPSRRSKHSK